MAAGGPAGEARRHGARRCFHPRPVGQGQRNPAQCAADQRRAHRPAADRGCGKRAAAGPAWRRGAGRVGCTAGTDSQYRTGSHPSARDPRHRRGSGCDLGTGGDRCRRADRAGDRSATVHRHRAAADRSRPCGAGGGVAQRHPLGRLWPRRPSRAGECAHVQRCESRRSHRHFRPRRALSARVPGRHDHRAAPRRKPRVSDRRPETGRTARPWPRCAAAATHARSGRAGASQRCLRSQRSGGPGLGP